MEESTVTIRKNLNISAMESKVRPGVDRSSFRGLIPKSQLTIPKRYTPLVEVNQTVLAWSFRQMVGS